MFEGITGLLDRPCSANDSFTHLYFCFKVLCLTRNFVAQKTAISQQLTTQL